MKISALVSVTILGLISATASAETSFPDYKTYCKVISEGSTPTLLFRIMGETKERAIQLMDGMTDPISIRLVREAIEFAWSRPPTMGLEAMRSELFSLCLAKRIFVQ